MGDRAEVTVIDGTSKVVLYTHWCGTELPETLRRAMIRGESRWDDAPYLARTIVCEMIKEDGGRENGLDKITGIGISSQPQDSEHKPLTVNTDEQTVQMGDYIFTFEQYIKEERVWL